MKRLFSLFLLVIIANSCDDGNLILENINFDNATVASCPTNKIIYKLNEKEALLLELPSVEFPNETKTQQITIGGTNRAVYRFFNGTVTSSTICETIPPVNPIVVDQWTAKDGIIEITTTPIKNVDATTNSTKIKGYNHYIVLKNVTFEKASGPQIYSELIFGNYTINISGLPFAFTKILQQCSDKKQVYSFIGSESLVLNNIDANLIKNEVTPLNTPRTALIGTTSNALSYKLYSGLLTNDFFCNVTTPATPTVLQEWRAVAGTDNIEGIIEVTTTSFGTGFKHTIVLKKVKMKRGNDDFLLGDNYQFGELITTN